MNSTDYTLSEHVFTVTFASRASFLVGFLYFDPHLDIDINSLMTDLVLSYNRHLKIHFGLCDFSLKYARQIQLTACETEKVYRFEYLREMFQCVFRPWTAGLTLERWL